MNLKSSNLKTLKDIECHGIYRIWIDGKDQLIYIGETQDLSRRLTDHARKTANLRIEEITFSFVKRPNLDKHQLTEVECDLIGAHYKATNKPPSNQFKQNPLDIQI